MSTLTQSRAWRAVETHARQLQQASRIAGLFEQDAQRAQRFSAEGAGLYLDYSKQWLTPESVELLVRLADQQGLARWTDRLFGGEPVNSTENRAALHIALRAPRTAVMFEQGRDVVPDVHGVLDRMGAFAQRVRSGEWQGHTGRAITDVVNIGIGGSDLGPRMVCEALKDLADGPRMHFIANVDGTPLAALTRSLDPDTTLWIVTSKTFTTQETMANAQAARRWFLERGREDGIARHFVAVSTNRDEVGKFGIHPDNMFEFWDWVGGRYSLWSAVGLSIVVAIGAQRFGDLLAGAHAMDRHFRTAVPGQNLPVLMALIGIWNTNFLNSATQVIAPYAERLCKLPAWLQQLEMESNGKSVDREGQPVDYRTTPALWGDVGTNAQHAFFQMLHQGTAVHPVDFILPAAPDHELTDQHRMLMANCFAQSAALMRGKSAAEVRAELVARGMDGAELEAAVPHRVFAGNRPSSTILLPRLDPRSLGALLALYEHRAFVQSVVWNINPFDQWGVELGKQLAQSVLQAMDGQAVMLDGSTRQLIDRTR
ncbi:MAG TPA: glucose-6-phosphate isomerase [Candidatus Binatia bacterium]|nr:glucose-6-phosphate isomerase [Candidatus Binatia bacterium]